MPSLGALLVSRKLVDINSLRQAMVRQVVVGGSLDTALLEQTSVNEAELLELLELATAFPRVTEEIYARLSPRIAEVIPQDTSENLGICPVCWQGGKLVVLTTERVNFISLDELSFDMGVQLIPLVATELRVVQARSIVYQQTLEERFRRLLGSRGRSLQERDLQHSLEVDIDIDLDEAPADQHFSYMDHLTPEERMVVEVQIMHRQTFLD